MLVLHGAWGVGRTTGDAAFLFWAEDRAASARPTERPTEPSAAPRPHPLQATPAGVRRALGTLVALTRGLPDELRSSAASWAIRLPTRDGRPLPSGTTDDGRRTTDDRPCDRPSSVVSRSSSILYGLQLEAWQVRGRAVGAGQVVWLLGLLM